MAEGLRTRVRFPPSPPNKTASPLWWGFFICVADSVDENQRIGLTAMDGRNARNAGAIPGAADIDISKSALRLTDYKN